MSDLLRPEPPPDWRARITGAVADLRPTRVAAGLITIVVTALAAAWLLRAPAPAVESTLPPARPLTAPTPSAVAGAGLATTTTATEVVVQAAGAVAQPGVYRLPAGARVADVITAAGGVTADADPAAVLLAAVVADGERVYVPRVGEAPPPVVAGPASATGTAAPSGPLNLNTATADDLDELPGVGPATAAAIVAHRDTAGPYASVDQLLDVKGIGPAKLEALRPLVTI